MTQNTRNKIQMLSNCLLEYNHPNHTNVYAVNPTDDPIRVQKHMHPGNINLQLKDYSLLSMKMHKHHHHHINHLLFHRLVRRHPNQMGLVETSMRYYPNRGRDNQQIDSMLLPCSDLQDHYILCYKGRLLSR